MHTHMKGGGRTATAAPAGSATSRSKVPHCTAVALAGAAASRTRESTTRPSASTVAMTPPPPAVSMTKPGSRAASAGEAAAGGSLRVASMMAPTERLTRLSAAPRGSGGACSAPLSRSLRAHHPKRSVPASSTTARLNGLTYVRPSCE
eukprot:scaffold121934_cov66-Phaeocystis_antarctica.AAC.5